MNLDAYQYGGLNPVKYIDPNGMWIDKSEKVIWTDRKNCYKGTLNQGIVTKGDTLHGLAERQLIIEKGTDKFTGIDVVNKINDIKKFNGLNSNTIRIGQKLKLGLTNAQITEGEKGVVPLGGESLIAAFGILKLGAISATTVRVGAPMLAEGTIEMGASAKALGIAGGNMILTNPVPLNKLGVPFINGISPPSPYTANSFKIFGFWGAGYLVGQAVNYYLE